MVGGGQLSEIERFTIRPWMETVETPHWRQRFWLVSDRIVLINTFQEQFPHSVLEEERSIQPLNWAGVLPGPVSLRLTWINHK